MLHEMRDRVLRHASGPVCTTVIPRLSVGTADRPSDPVSVVYEPMVCLVLQGAKQVMIGDRVLRYDPASSFIASLELPVSGRVIEATPARPMSRSDWSWTMT